MATLKTSMPANWAHSHSTETNISLWQKFTAFADSQQERKTMWFFLALVVQGIFFLPLPVFLVYYYDAPALPVLLVTMTCFFSTIIAYMGGASIRAVLLMSAISILIQVIMSVVVIIL